MSTRPLVDVRRMRLSAVALITVTLFATLFARLWYLQVIAANQFRVAAQTNGVRLIYTPAPRGRILDDQGRVLVDNQVVQELTVGRQAVHDHPELLGRLAALLSTGPQPKTIKDLRAALADPRYDPLAPVPLGIVDTATAVFVAEHADEFPGVDVTEVPERTYPHGALAAHLLGYVGQINDSELRAHPNQGYRPGDEIGKSGIEAAYESVLRGQPGVTKLEVDSSGRVLGVLGKQDPVQGHDVRLTIDLDIQALAEQSLAQGIAAAQSTYDRQDHRDYAAPAGAVVVIDPRDGSIKALASYPTYDPAEFVNGISTALYEQLQQPSMHEPLTDRATSGLYAPGSTFKLITATAALTRGLIQPNSTFYDQGFVKVGNQIFHNAGGYGYGRINVTTAITVSSDDFFYTLGAAFWNARRTYGLAIQDTARAYGLGQHSGIPIGDEAGRVPDPATRARLHQLYPQAFPNGTWYTGDNVNLAIGQGELVVTPLQLANAYATFANGGTLYTPRVASEILDADGTKVADVPPHPIRQIVYPPGVHDAMLAGFQGVVSDSDGTAAGAFAGFPFSRFPLAGKTGTAQVNGKQDTSVFNAWGPVTDPQYVVTSFIEQAGFGTSIAAPVVRRIFEGLAGLTPGQVHYLQAAENAQNN